ncbi:MAG TPA: hypothetical protein VIY48_19305 [Candidatus Paceibacterota bacterium]
MPPAAKKTIEAPKAVLKPGAIVTVVGARGTYADAEVLFVTDTHLELAGQAHLPPYAATLALPWASIFTISVMG